MRNNARPSPFRGALSPSLGVCALLVLAACAGRGQQAAGGAQTSPERGAVASVEGREIPAAVFEMYLKNGREGLGLDEGTGDGRRRLGLLREGVVSELIDRELIRREAERRGLRPDPARAVEEERRAVEQFGGEEKFSAYLAAHGLSREEFMETVRSPLYGELLRRELARDLKVTDEELKTFYESHRTDAEFSLPERVAASHILIAARPSVVERQLREEKGLAGEELRRAVAAEMARRRARAEEVRLRLFKRGPGREPDFAALAREHSDDAGTRARGGALGLFPRGAHAKAFDDAAFALKVGEVSGVVQTDFGFHVIRLEGREPARALTFEAAAPELRRRLLARREAEALKGWLGGARRSAKIRVAEAYRTGALREEFPGL